MSVCTKPLSGEFNFIHTVRKALLMNNRYWSNENPHALIQLPLYDQKIGAWRAISASRIIGPICYEETLDAQQYINEILNPFFVNLAPAVVCVCVCVCGR
jgi:hypothetical protein